MPNCGLFIQLQDHRLNMQKIEITFGFFMYFIFPKWQFPYGIFLSGKFPNLLFPKRQLYKRTQSVLALVFQCSAPQPVLAAALGSPLQPAAPQRTKPNLWEIAAWEIEFLGSCHFGNCHLGSLPWKNAFGKVPNTHYFALLLIKRSKTEFFFLRLFFENNSRL